MYENNRDGIAELFPPGPVLQSLDLHMEGSHQCGCPRRCRCCQVSSWLVGCLLCPWQVTEPRGDT